MKSNHTEIIKDKLSILDVVGSYVKLEKAGKTWKGKSPFTNEKTASFFVSLEKGFFYCFSSSKGGDIFTFIQEIERVDFKDALKLLADKAGVDLGSNQGPSVNGVLYKILDDATKWYEVNLRKNKDSVDYLLERGLSKETMVKFRLGFAKDSWRDVYDFLKKKGYSNQNIEQAGLIVAKDGGGHYDRFRSRIMFPLMDPRGRVIGFSGRIFSDDPDVKGAKYVNSPEGPLFDKSQVLYGYHSAKTEISKQESCILVEGQLDVLMAQQAGSINTVAVSGTGLTDGHINMIKRFASTVLLSFDSDNAGIKATRRSVLKVFEHGMTVKVIVLPFGQDPADIISKSVPQWEIFVSDAKDYISYRLEIFDKQNPESDFDQKHKLVTGELFDFVYLMESSVLQDKVLQELALFLGVSIESMRNDFDVYQPDDEVTNIQQVETVKQEIFSDSVPTGESSREEIIGLSLYLQQEYPKDWKQELEDTSFRFKEAYGMSLESSQSDLDESIRAMFSFKNEAQLEGLDFKKILDRLNLTLNPELIRSLKQQSQELLIQIRKAEHGRDDVGAAKKTAENQTLQRRIHEITNL